MTDVFHLTASNARRGAETFAVELAGALEARGMTGTLRSVVDAGRDRLPIEALPGGRWSPRGLLALRRLARAADVCVAHGSISLPAMALARVTGGAPFVYRGIGEPLYWSSTRARRMRTRAFLGRAAAVTAVWSGTARVLVDRFGVPADRVHVIPRGVDASRFAATTPAAREKARAELGVDGLVVAMVGALSAEKRVDRAVEVVRRVPGATLLLAGDGPAAVPESANVRRLGSLADVTPVLAAADVLLLTSDTEGIPGVVIEAAFTGLPTVATRVGGITDVVVDGRTGFLFEPDQVDAMADAVQRAAADREAMGAAAREHCLATFELSVIADKWAALLRSVAWSVDTWLRPVQWAFNATRRRLAIVTMHAVPDGARFERHLDVLGEMGTFVGLDDVVGGGALPRRPILVTFDDGDRTLVDVAAPALARRGIPAVAFVVTDLVGTDQPFWFAAVEAAAGRAEVNRLKTVPDDERRAAIAQLDPPLRQAQLTADELRALDAQGIAIGSHSATHPCLDRCGDDVIRDEVTRSFDALADLFGRPPVAFAYPNGNHDARARRAVADAGYRIAFAFDHRLTSMPPPDPFAVSRLRLAANAPDDRVRTIVSGVHPFLHRARGRS